MAGLRAPLPTLRRRPRGRRRTARGRCGSLLLHRSGLAPPTPCRSPGAVAGRDRPVLLQLGEEVLDQVTRLVEVLIVGARLLAVRLGRDHRRLAGLRERPEDALLGVERLVGDQRVRGQVRQQRVRTLQVVRLPRREGGAGRVAERVDQGVNLRAQAAAAAPDRLVAAPFLIAPALCWWARTIVPSIIAYSLSASPAKCRKTRSHTPVLAQRQKRVWTFFQAPNRSGRSRQGMPARYRYSTASTNSRLSLAVTPTHPSRPGRRSLILSHWSSRRAERRIGRSSSAANRPTTAYARRPIPAN